MRRDHRRDGRPERLAADRRRRLSFELDSRSHRRELRPVPGLGHCAVNQLVRQNRRDLVRVIDDGRHEDVRMPIGRKDRVKALAHRSGLAPALDDATAQRPAHRDPNRRHDDPSRPEEIRPHVRGDRL